MYLSLKTENDTPLKLQLKLFFEMVNFLVIQQEKFIFFLILIKITQIFNKLYSHYG
jgi:hypothetical protein